MSDTLPSGLILRMHSRSVVNYNDYEGAIVPFSPPPGTWVYLIPRQGAFFWRSDGLSEPGGIRCELGDVIELHDVDMSMLRIAAAEESAEVEIVTSPIRLSTEDLKGKL